MNGDFIVIYAARWHSIIQLISSSGFAYINVVSHTGDKHRFWLLAWLHQCSVHSCGVTQFSGSQKWYGNLYHLHHSPLWVIVKVHCSVQAVSLNFCVLFQIEELSWVHHSVQRSIVWYNQYACMCPHVCVCVHAHICVRDLALAKVLTSKSSDGGRMKLYFRTNVTTASRLQIFVNFMLEWCSTSFQLRK
jgi:hypothetical protein